ncbi:MAG: Phosphatidylinositol (PI) 3-kinase [Chrysothrix sp. TS-e1954]|nr:MAG: Phosphatidylinositol (PI) 3-kinase [Chrysothrix sp. TS-e1954]
MENDKMDCYTFAGSSDLDLPRNVVKSLNASSNRLDGHQEPIPYSILLRRPDLRYLGSTQNPNSELHVTVQLWAESKPLTVPIQTAYKAFKNARVWMEWLILPIKYSDIPLSSQLAITLWDVSPVSTPDSDGHAVPFGGTTISLFDDDNTLRKGKQRCHLYRYKRADGLHFTTTPAIARISRRRGGEDEAAKDPDLKELERLEALMKKQEMREIPENPWLDQMVYRHVEQLQQKVSKKFANGTIRTRRSLTSDSAPKQNGALNGTPHDEDQIDPGHYFIYIDFPRFDHPVVFTDTEYPAPPISTMTSSHLQSSEVDLRPPPEVTLGPGINENTSEAGRLIRIYDPEVGFKENPVENKHRRLFRNQRGGIADRDAKPNAKARDDLALIISAGPTEELSQPDKDLVWRFRHHLMRNKRALTKFVKSTNWTDPTEARQAVHLLPKWTEIDVDDALELLGPTISNPDVRAYAVERLRKADDEELLLYLLQLVQALKFEKVEAQEAPEETAQDSSLARFLISRASQDMRLGNFLHWYLMVECSDTSPGQSPEHRALFSKVSYDFMTALERTQAGRERRTILRRQGELITVLSKISKDCRFSREDRLRKIDRIRKQMADPDNDLLTFDPPLPLPLDPAVKIIGCYPQESSVFKSSLFPLLLHFKTTDNKHYPVIFKTGDDLRQDQLVIQIIMLMDRLLRRENLDLKLTPYSILATSPLAGAVQFIPSMSLAAIVAKYSSKSGPPLLTYLRTNNPDPKADFGVRKDAMENYIKSCAGYCVITYLLGVGDRHLDNLLLTPAGCFFHADFGYILGRDPKPFAPLMKLSREMIEGMGGTASPQYASFKQYCFTAYTTLRKSSNLILNLFSLMVDANVQDIRMEPERAVQKVKERFHLEVRGEEEVMRVWEGLVEESVGAVGGAIIDRVHGFVQKFRA